jgi:hypothetical protein
MDRFGERKGLATIARGGSIDAIRVDPIGRRRPRSVAEARCSSGGARTCWSSAGSSSLSSSGPT